VRILIDPQRVGAGDRAEVELAAFYAAPSLPWLRANMVASVDGAATGETGRSDSINNAADKQVFDTLRALADAVVVGAGTARVEGYRPADRPLVLVSRSGALPERLLDGPPGTVLLATCEVAPGLAVARERLGAEQVLVLGSHSVDLVALRGRLVERGLRHLLCEGGPHLLRDLLAARVVDELCTTVVPRLVGGLGPRITDGPLAEAPLRLHGLLEDDGTLLARWLVGVR
jgi:riboflavin biosynthesis pyrimidine reductase